MESSATPLRFACQKCYRIVYLNPKVGVAILIEYDQKVLLARRAREPMRGWWTLPAGYVEYDESCEHAAVREAQEELSVDIVLNDLLGVYSYGDDPRSRMVLIVYTAECDWARIQPKDDIDACDFFPVDKLPARIAFQGNRDALDTWARLIR